MEKITGDDIFLSICGFTIRISFSKFENEVYRKIVRTEIAQLYQGFLITHLTTKLDYHIEFIDHDQTIILKQGKRNFLFFYEKIRRKKIQAYSHIGWIHLSIIFRNILSELLTGKGFIIHASASLVKNKAYIFLGQSGAGKSTMTQLLQSKWPVLADDCVVIKKEFGEFYLYQTPFFEKNKVKNVSGQKYPIHGFYFLKQSLEYKIKEVIPHNLISKFFMEQLYVDHSYIKNDMKTVLRFLARNYKFYFLSFAKDSVKMNRLIADNQ